MKLILYISTIVLFFSCNQGPDDKAIKDVGSSKSIAQNDVIPVKNALAFINLYVSANDSNSNIGLEERINSINLTTYRFRKDLKSIIDEANKIDSEMGLESDPVLNAQDYPDKGFVVESFDEKTNLIVVKGKDWPEFKLTIKMVLENDNWLVDGCGRVNFPYHKSISK